MKYIKCDDALAAYERVLQSFEVQANRHNHNFEIEDLFLESGGDFSHTYRLRGFLDHLTRAHPMRLARGLLKAERAYERQGDRITKPSYINRVRSFPDFSKRTNCVSAINQIKSVSNAFVREPNASYHVISVFRPIDLLEKFRPGYVPCVIMADFKYRKKHLTGKFIFRSCDAYNVLPFDMFYCVQIINELVDEIRLSGFDKPLDIGKVCFYFSRIFVSRFDRVHISQMLEEIAAFDTTTAFTMPGKFSKQRGRFRPANAL